MKPIFVYGTLRPGNRLFRMIAPAVSSVAPATVSGRLYHVKSGSDGAPVYPVAKFDEPGIIRGDVLFVNEKAEAFLDVDAMECCSGYSQRWVKLTADWLGKYPGWAMTYQYDRDPGALIESGEWTHG